MYTIGFFNGLVFTGNPKRQYGGGQDTRRELYTTEEPGFKLPKNECQDRCCISQSSNCCYYETGIEIILVM